jgi:hypothetical protein
MAVTPQRIASPLGPRIGRFRLYWICSNPPAGGMSLKAPFCQSLHAIAGRRTVCTESTLHCLVSPVTFSSHTKRPTGWLVFWLMWIVFNHYTVTYVTESRPSLSPPSPFLSSSFPPPTRIPCIRASDYTVKFDTIPVLPISPSFPIPNSVSLNSTPNQTRQSLFFLLIKLYIPPLHTPSTNSTQKECPLIPLQAPDKTPIQAQAPLTSLLPLCLSNTLIITNNTSNSSMPLDPLTPPVRPVQNQKPTPQASQQAQRMPSTRPSTKSSSARSRK